VNPASSDAEIARLQEELDAANRKLSEEHKMASLGRLSAGIVHEINTPIGSIFSNNEVIIRTLDKLKALLLEAQQTGTPPPQKVIDMLTTIATLTEVDKLACDRISGVVRSLKSLARVTSSELRKAGLNELVGHTLKLAGTVFNRRITFEQVRGDIPEVECYPGLLGQVLLNLVVNAAQAIEGDGTVTVRTWREDDRVGVSVTDTGQGIRLEDQAKIFQPGFTTKPIGEGTGIGLTLSCQIIVETHHGTLTFESQPGLGTTFFVRIPIVQEKKDE
jgi:two-component system, NtrC family, sensor kinase